MINKFRVCCKCSSFRIVAYRTFHRSVLDQTFKNSEDIDFKNPRDTKLTTYLNRLMCFKGPITVSEYMKEALTNPVHGYYMTKDVFGQSGDFITSPEINQLFGEMIGIWIINEWRKIWGKTPLYLIELGPGRGTMMSDILRVFKMLKLVEGVSCHLVEVSPELSRLQAEKLKVVGLEKYDNKNESTHFQKGVTENGIPVFWYKHMSFIPPEFSVIVAHEFFDALPIHKFKKTDRGWREVLIAPDPKDPEGRKFCYVLAQGATANAKVYVKDDDTRDEVEVSPQSGIVMNELATRLEGYGGFALIADYGHNGELTDTFRAYKGHKQQDPLVDPGSADLTADVDFSYLKANTLDKLITFGPVEQRDFLRRVHIDVRLKMLLSNCKDDVIRNSIINGYTMMMDPKQMGSRFKFMSFFPAVLESYLQQKPVAGFVE